MSRFVSQNARDSLQIIRLKQLANTFRNIIEAKTNRSYVQSYPQIVDIVLTKACNLKCAFCKDYETEGAKAISVENFTRAAEILFPTARKLSLCSGGEPYLHKRLIDFLRISKEYRVPTWLLSNGTRMTDEISKTIVDEQLVTWHGFSVDGCDAETVESIRIKSNFDLIVRNISRLLDFRQQGGSRFPRVVIRFVLMRSTIEQLPDAVKLWGSKGVDRIDCSYLSVCNGIDPQESLFFHKKLTQRMFSKAVKICDKFPHLSLCLPDPFGSVTQLGLYSRRCHQPWELIRIDADGAIMPCFHSWRQMTMGNIGVLDRSSFNPLWSGSRYRSIRSTVNDDSRPKYYSHCANCPERVTFDRQFAHFEDDNWIRSSVLAGSDEQMVRTNRKR
jgi:radical SAM protein with 4Fe4S-binding SPASM domain